MPSGVYERTYNYRTPEWLAQNPLKGVPISEEHRAKISASKTGKPHLAEEANPLWKGDSVGYFGLHAWVTAHAGRAALQKCAHADDTCSSRMEWANVSQQYLRDLDDFIPLCKSHHKRYDKAVSR